MPESFRGLRKFSCALILSCGIDKKMRSHHEAHEGHEGFVNFITFELRALRDLRGEMSVSTLVAALPR
jgi:hypothetical protein